MSNTNPLYYRSARELVHDMQSNGLTCVEVLEAHLRRIEQCNPTLNAIVTLVADSAMQRAQQLDKMPIIERQRYPLFGLPIAHKDLTPTAGVRTTHGSPIFANHVPKEDSLLVTRLRNAGTVMLGKTNTPEFGAGSQTFNEVFGTTLNPYDPERTCGGSSGGAAVALASGMLPIADGSDLGGSLRNPAAFCNVVGLRPSQGRVPSWPAVNAWNSLSTEGPMAREVGDVALMLSAMAGPDARAPLSLSENCEAWAQIPLAKNLSGKRIALCPDFGGDLEFESPIVDTIAALEPLLVDLGAKVIHEPFDFGDADRVFEVSRAAMFAGGFGNLLKTQPDKLKETIIWNIEKGLALTAAEITEADQLRTNLYLRLQQYMQGVDAIILPTTQVLPFSIDTEFVTEINGQPQRDYLDWMRSVSRITVTSHPAISLPAGFSNNLPIGMQIVGRAQQDVELLHIAHAIEQATLFHQKQPQ